MYYTIYKVAKRKGVFLIALFFCFALSGFSLSANQITSKSDTLTSQQKFDFKYAFIDANRQLMLGNYSVAQGLFLQCLKIDNNSSACLYQLAYISYSLKEYEKALIHAQRAVKKAPKNLWYNFLLSSIYQELNDLENAAKIYQQLIKIYPNNYDLYFEYSSLLALNKQFSKSIKVCNKLESSLGFSEKIAMQRIKVYFMNNDKKSAYKELNSLINNLPNEKKYYLILADSYINDKNLVEAKMVYQSLLKVYPSNGEAHFFLAQYYIQKKEFAKFFEELKRVFESKSFDAEQKVQMFVSFSKSIGDNKELNNKFNELFNILLETNPENIDVKIINSDYLYRNKKYSKAREELEYIITKKKDNIYVWQQLLLTDNMLEDFESMFEHSKESVKYFPNQSFFYLFKGLSSYQLKNYQISIESLDFGKKLVVETDPLKKQFYLYLGEAYYQLKNYDKSFSNFDIYLNIEPEDTYVLNNYSYYLSLLDRDLERAEQMSKKSITLEPKNSTFLDTHAWVLFKRKSFSEAQKIIKLAIENGGDSSSVIVEHFGDILFKNNKTDEAVIQWKKAKSLGSSSKNLDKKITEEKLIN
ncbi:MAG: tetratricopeptide repeat protein [Bacteroidetes bacterium]|nr:tetratricopeptide repeat protein [Bacteroidota bacterium]